MRLNKFVFLALFALVCFASQLRADVPPIIWYKTFGGSINTLNLHPSGEKLLISAIQSEEGFNTVVVSADSGNIIKSYPLKHADEIQEWSKYSKSGKYTVFGGEYNGGSYSFIRVVDNDADTVVFDKEWNYSFLRSFDISPDETILALGGQGWLEFYDLASGVKTDSIPFFGYQSTPKFIGNISYSPNGIYLAYTNESDGALEIINASSHQKYISTASPKWYGRLRFSPNSKLLAFNSSLDNTAIEILNLDSMKVLDKVAGYVQSTADIVFTKDSKNILFTRLGSLGGLYIYYLNSKNILEIENASTYRFFQLSSNEKTSYLSIGDMVFKIDITSSMNVEHIHTPHY